MSYKPDEKDWMAYLYGELEDVDKVKFDQYLLEHPDARDELERYQRIRQLLSLAEDKEVLAPPIFIDEAPSSEGGRHLYFWNSHAFKVISAVAASILLILWVGYLSDARLKVSNHEFHLTFGEEPRQNQSAHTLENTLSAHQVQKMIDASLDKNNTVVKANLEATQKDLETSLRKNLAVNSGRIHQLVEEASTASQDQIRQYVEGMRTESMAQVKDYFQLTSTEQKKYIENLLVDFAKYLQQQRNNDLQLVQTRMNSLEQNTDMFRQETEQILSSIITTVGATPVSEETKY